MKRCFKCVYHTILGVSWTHPWDQAIHTWVPEKKHVIIQKTAKVDQIDLTIAPESFL